jgi:hypothetical protein
MQTGIPILPLPPGIPAVTPVLVGQVPQPRREEGAGEEDRPHPHPGLQLVQEQAPARQNAGP